ncbi:hypothetical protein [Marinomonas sp.]|uniref:hypothetical protein n=1 Tax=Marinomonas sp. TaxID=1904862 RepID=UPI003BA85554
MSGAIMPDPIADLEKFIGFLKNNIHFSFIRFSDGEVEILRNRYLEISKENTVFRGRIFKNKFPDFDSKKFDPKSGQKIRKDLLDSSLFRSDNFFKGVPTRHNNAVRDREFLLRLNGGFTESVTFSDLFLNSNYSKYRNEVVPLFSNYKGIYVIANYRAKPIGLLSNAHHIEIPDNFFLKYDEVVSNVYEKIENVPAGSLILSSASSLSNILGHMLYLKNANVTFLDIGTSINDLLSLDHNTRVYHRQKKTFFHKIIRRNPKGFDIKW